MADPLELDTAKWIAAIERLPASMPQRAHVVAALVAWLDERRFVRAGEDVVHRAPFYQGLSVTDVPLPNDAAPDRPSWPAVCRRIRSNERVCMLWYPAIGLEVDAAATRRWTTLMHEYTDATLAVADALRHAGLDVGFVQTELVGKPAPWPEGSDDAQNIAPAGFVPLEATGMRVLCAPEWSRIAEVLRDTCVCPEVLAVRLAATQPALVHAE